MFSRCPSFAWVFKMIIESYCAETQFDSSYIFVILLWNQSFTVRPEKPWTPEICHEYLSKIIKPQKYRIPNACLSLLKIIYYPELISRGFFKWRFFQWVSHMHYTNLNQMDVKEPQGPSKLPNPSAGLTTLWRVIMLENSKGLIRHPRKTKIKHRTDCLRRFL